MMLSDPPRGRLFGFAKAVPTDPVRTDLELYCKA
jgi:hypothetical protein